MRPGGSAQAALALLLVVLPLTASASSCTTDTDCSLNGVCTSGTCVCDPPWTGDFCHLLDFLPVSFPQGYGMVPNTTTWGGGIIRDPGSGLYHMFVSRMTNNCTLQHWTKNSRVDHVTSKDPTGPYEFRDVAINTWAHNAAPVVLPDGTYAIFHIGDGTGPADGGDNCTSAAGDGGLDVVGDLRQRQPPPTAAGGSTIHVSASLDGPWTPLVPNTLGNCNNPAPWQHPNGTLFIICQGQLKRASSIHGPWTDVAPTQHSGGVPGDYEDPYLFTDKRGNFHLLYHVYIPKPAFQCVNATVSAHAFSADGYTWLSHPVQPYGTQIHMADGSTTTVSTRERPKLFFDAKGTPTHLLNGVCSAPACPPPTGPHTGCVDCKYASWDYTLVAPLNV